MSIKVKFASDEDWTHSLWQLHRFLSENKEQGVARSVTEQDRHQPSVKLSEAVLDYYYSVIFVGLALNAQIFDKQLEPKRMLSIFVFLMIRCIS